MGRKSVPPVGSLPFRGSDAMIACNFRTSAGKGLTPTGT